MVCDNAQSGRGKVLCTQTISEFYLVAGRAYTFLFLAVLLLVFLNKKEMAILGRRVPADIRFAAASATTDSFSTTCASSDDNSSLTTKSSISTKGKKRKPISPSQCTTRVAEEGEGNKPFGKRVLGDRALPVPLEISYKSACNNNNFDEVRGKKKRRKALQNVEHSILVPKDNGNAKLFVEMFNPTSLASYHLFAVDENLDSNLGGSGGDSLGDSDEEDEKGEGMEAV